MKHEKANSLPAMLVFALFALLLLLVLLTGARVYRETVTAAEQASELRTKLQYLSTKVRQSREITLEAFGGLEALTLREEVDGECYVTYIYCYGGWLRELTAPAGAALTPADGEKVIPARELSVKAQEDLLTLTLDGETLFFAGKTGGVP